MAKSNFNFGRKRKKIELGSIVFFRSRKWRYTENRNCKAHLILLETEKPVKFENGYVTEVNTDISNIILADEVASPKGSQ